MYVLGSISTSALFLSAVLVAISSAIAFGRISLGTYALGFIPMDTAAISTFGLKSTLAVFL